MDGDRWKNVWGRRCVGRGKAGSRLGRNFRFGRKFVNDKAERIVMEE